MIKRYGKGGWFGNSHGHSLAAKGVRMYSANKKQLMDPLFYANKRESEVPYSHVREMVRKGDDFNDMKRMHPDSDPEVIRKTGLKVLGDSSGNNIMDILDSNGVDSSVAIARVNPAMRVRMLSVLGDSQKSSFLPDIKVQLLKKRLSEVSS